MPAPWALLGPALLFLLEADGPEATSVNDEPPAVTPANVWCAVP